MNNNDITNLVALLQYLEPGFYPYVLFKALCRLVAVPIVELVPLRQTQNGTIEVLLLERSEDDDIWPNEVHTPGTVVRATDAGAGIDGVFRRIIQDELGGLKLTTPEFVTSLLHESKRSTEQAEVYWAEVLEGPKQGYFCSVNNLPKNIIDSQRTFIALAAASFTAHKSLLVHNQKYAELQRIKKKYILDTYSLVDVDEHKPWGAYYRLDDSHADVFIKAYFPDINVRAHAKKVTLSPKFLVFEPGKRLSLQYHHRRAEVWHVIEGTLEAAVSDTDTEGEWKTYSEGEQLSYGAQVRHRAGAPVHGTWVVVAEIWQHTDEQNPTNEEDIVRLADDFGRAI